MEASCGTFSSSTMIVMMIAITPSLNASSRCLPIASTPRLGERQRQPRLERLHDARDLLGARLAEAAAEQAQRRIPRRVLAIEQPAPVGVRPEHHPALLAHRT